VTARTIGTKREAVLEENDPFAELDLDDLEHDCLLADAVGLRSSST
jgi:hypothetical protein